MANYDRHALDGAVEALGEELIRITQGWIRQPSLKAEPAPGAPFGPAVRAVLDLALADAARLGFAPRDIDGYAADLEIGQGEETIAILAHLDVVPAGDGWNTPPFEPVIAEGKLYGRGVSDDKGPAAAALIAMKAVQDAGIPLQKKVRLVLGCDEESGWADIAYYQEHVGLPAVGFSPDACFPIINTEKGILRVELTCTLPEEGESAITVLRLRSGERANVIPSVAEAELGGNFDEILEKTEAFAQRTGYPIAVEPLDNRDGGARVVVSGVGGHASMPELGQNAAAHLLQLLHALEAGGGSHEAIQMLAQTIGGDSDGTGFGIAGSDEVSGPLTVNLGILDLQDRKLSATLDIRYPVLFNAEQITRFIAMRVQPAGIQVEGGRGQAPHHVPETRPIVRALLDTYHEVTGLPPSTLAIGGGTYARAMHEAVAFGCVFPGEEELAHQANECMELDKLKLSAKVFAHAIVALAGE